MTCTKLKKYTNKYEEKLILRFNDWIEIISF